MALFRCGNSNIRAEMINKTGANIENAVIGDYYVIASSSALATSITGADIIIRADFGGASLIRATATTVVLGDSIYPRIIHLMGVTEIDV